MRLDDLAAALRQPVREVDDQRQLGELGRVHLRQRSEMASQRDESARHDRRIGPKPSVQDYHEQSDARR